MLCYIAQASLKFTAFGLLSTVIVGLCKQIEKFVLYIFNGRFYMFRYLLSTL